MCSRVRACLPGRPCPPCPAPHVGKGRGMLGSAPGVFKEMLRGCSGDTQGMPRGMPRRVWSIQQSSAAQGSLAWRPLAATGPQAFASSEEGTGWQRGSLLPRAHPEPRPGLCAALQQLQPRSLPGGWHRGCSPSPSSCSKPGCGAGERDEPWGGAAALLGMDAPSCWGWSPRGWDPRQQRAEGWPCTPASGTLHPCKAREAPVPRGVMSQAGIPQKRWTAKSSQSRGGVGSSRGEAQAGSPMS